MYLNCAYKIKPKPMTSAGITMKDIAFSLQKVVTNAAIGYRESDMSIALLQTTPELEGCSEAEIFTRDSIKKAKISTGMYTIYHQGGIMAGYSTDVRSIAAIRFIASPYCSRITGGCQLSSAVISGT